MKVKTLIESLRTINRKLGGTVEANESVKSLVNEIADNFQPGGSGLPEVTSADNDKILTVVNGAWNKASPPAGALPDVTQDDNGKIATVVGGLWGKADRVSDIEFFDIYNYSEEGEYETQYVVYCTLEQIRSAFLNGKTCYARTYRRMGGWDASEYETRYLITGYNYIGNPPSGENPDGYSFSIDVLMPNPYDSSYVSFVQFYGDERHIYPSTNGAYIDPSFLD